MLEVKIGRNEPCPCGSGKKYKQCCGNRATPGGESRSVRNAVSFFRRIAYAGEVGRARDAFCVAYAERKRAEFEEIARFQRERSLEEGLTVQCRRGCTFCCAHFVGGSLEECEAVVHHLYTHGKALSVFLDGYPPWRAAVAAEESLFRSLASSFRRMVTEGFREEVAGTHRDLCKRYESLNIACPFLHEGSCIVYPVRPRGCAALYATTPGDWCDPRTPQQPRQLAVTAHHREPDFYFGGFVPLVLSNVPLMVYELLKGGYVYLASMPGLGGMDRAALNDPEVIRLTAGARRMR